jgi:hypothetical protein
MPQDPRRWSRARQARCGAAAARLTVGKRRVACGFGLFRARSSKQIRVIDTPDAHTPQEARPYTRPRAASTSAYARRNLLARGARPER